jgi:hypothetical protein
MCISYLHSCIIYITFFFWGNPKFAGVVCQYIKQKDVDMIKVYVFLINISFLLIFSTAFGQVNQKTLSEETQKRLVRVSEFSFLQEIAKDHNVNIYLSGSTAATFAHYVRQDLEREAGNSKFKARKFNYDLTEIFLPDQDVDLVVDGTLQQIQKIRSLLLSKYPMFKSSLTAPWFSSAFTLTTKKSLSLVNNKKDFLNQNTDSNSIGSILINPKSDEPVYSDLLPSVSTSSLFLSDVANAKITYISNPEHNNTLRYKQGDNPLVLSVLRYLVKVNRFDLKINPKDLKVIKQIVAEENWNGFSNSSKIKIGEFALSALLDSANLEKAWNLLESVGIRRRVIQLFKEDINVIQSVSWWLNKEPLRSKDFGTTGKSASEIAKENGLKDLIVSYTTTSYKDLLRLSSLNSGDEVNTWCYWRIFYLG